jgi:hypothetical protein
MMKLYGADGSELMEVAAIERDGSELVVKGKVFGAMPLAARLRPGEARRALRLLTPGFVLFLLTFLFRR